MRARSLLFQMRETTGSDRSTTIYLNRDHACLSSGWPLECETPSLAHRLHRFLDGEQLGRLIRFKELFFCTRGVEGVVAPKNLRSLTFFW